MKKSILLAVLLACFSAQAQQTINFENIPGDQPREGLVVFDQFKSTHGVTFRFEDGSPVILAKVGPPVFGFQGPGPNGQLNGGSDTPAPGQNIGSYFLTRKGLVKPPPLIIEYTTPVRAASGYLIDIDGSNTTTDSEEFTVEIRDQNNRVLQSVFLDRNTPGTGDGIATPFSFTRPMNDIYSIRIVCSGTRPGFGIAFDNFSPSSPISSNNNQGSSTANIPTRWKVNCNGYTGWLIFSVDQNTGKLNGTLLGTPVEGYLIGRRILLHRYPKGKMQTYEGWIIDKSLGAQGQPYYDNSWIISGSISQSGTGVDGEFPWYGVGEGK
jgi:hypothetical protein